MGHILTKSGLKPDEEKVCTLMEFLVPMIYMMLYKYGQMPVKI